MATAIDLRVLQPQPMLSVRGHATLPTLSQTIGEFLGEVVALLQERGLEASGMPFTRYHNTDPEDIDLEAGLPVAVTAKGQGRVRAGFLPGGEVAVLTHFGPYEGLVEAGASLAAQVAAAGREAAGAGTPAHGLRSCGVRASTEPAVHW